MRGTWRERCSCATANGPHGTRTLRSRNIIDWYVGSYLVYAMQALAVDRVVAAAASKALALSKALKSADPSFDMRLLGSQAESSSDSPVNDQ